MFKKLKGLLVVVLLIALVVGIYAGVTTQKKYYEGKQITLNNGDRVVVIINPTQLAPTTTDYKLIDYTVADSTFTCHIIVHGDIQ